MKLALNDYVKRFVPHSPYSCFIGSWEALLWLARFRWPTGEAGEAAVVFVPMPDEVLDLFRSGVVVVTEDTVLQSSRVRRNPEEEPYVETLGVLAEKAIPAKVNLGFYSHAKLAEKNEQSTEADYELVFIQAQLTLGEEPQHPVSMARNTLELEGGTKPEKPYTGLEWARSVHYWQDKVMWGGAS